MEKYSGKARENLLSMRNNIRKGLSEVAPGENWLDEYEVWKTKPENIFDSTLSDIDPFSLLNAGNRNFFDKSDPDQNLDLELITLSVFLSEKLNKVMKKTFSSVLKERNKYRKLDQIEHYFDIVDNVIASQNLSVAIVILNDFAEEQVVLKGKRTVDLYVKFYSLRENLRKRSVESIYFLFTEWRVDRDDKKLSKLISSIVDYIQAYYDDYDHDPDMHLYYPLDKLSDFDKLGIISHWLELIAFHTNGISEKYKDLKWLFPVDRMADDVIATNQISRYEMLLYKSAFSSDDNKTVQQKAICNHGYAIWIKTVDVMYVVTDIFQVLNYSSDDVYRHLGTSKRSATELYDKMVKIRDYFTRKMFFHQVYYESERHYIDSQVMEALEKDAEQISGSIDDIIEYVSAFADDDISGLMQAKQKYLTRLADYTSSEQEKKLDELTTYVVEKIKTVIEKTDFYNELYTSVSNDFMPYASELMKYPQIFSSLVSAEYLYQQYVEHKSPNPKFDYSCISIMYYMSLEDFVNRMIYIPYEKEILSSIPQANLADKKWVKEESKKYVSDFRRFWSLDKKHNEYHVKDSCEIGVLGYLFESLGREEYLRGFINTHYLGADVDRLRQFGIHLKQVAPRRNDAAHGGNYLTYSDVCADKENVYDSAREYRGMILELMNVLFGK